MARKILSQRVEALDPSPQRGDAQCPPGSADVGPRRGTLPVPRLAPPRRTAHGERRTTRRDVQGTWIGELGLGLGTNTPSTFPTPDRPRQRLGRDGGPMGGRLFSFIHSPQAYYALPPGWRCWWWTCKQGILLPAHVHRHGGGRRDAYRGPRGQIPNLERQGLGGAREHCDGLPLARPTGNKNHQNKIVFFFGLGQPAVTLEREPGCWDCQQEGDGAYLPLFRPTTAQPPHAPHRSFPLPCS